MSKADWLPNSLDVHPHVHNFFDFLHHHVVMVQTPTFPEAKINITVRLQLDVSSFRTQHVQTEKRSSFPCG